MDLYLKATKNEKGETVSRCPECRKEMRSPYIGEVAFCSRMCEMNYRYRMRNKDKFGQISISPDKVKKL